MWVYSVIAHLMHFDAYVIVVYIYIKTKECSEEDKL